MFARCVSNIKASTTRILETLRRDNNKVRYYFDGFSVGAYWFRLSDFINPSLLFSGLFSLAFSSAEAKEDMVETFFSADDINFKLVTNPTLALQTELFSRLFALSPEIKQMVTNDAAYVLKELKNDKYNAIEQLLTESLNAANNTTILKDLLVLMNDCFNEYIHAEAESRQNMQILLIVLGLTFFAILGCASLLIRYEKQIKTPFKHCSNQDSQVDTSDFEREANEAGEWQPLNVEDADEIEANPGDGSGSFRVLIT